MQGVWLEGGKLSVLENLDMPAPPPGEALIKVLRAGICNTDLELVAGYYPYCGILGHEFVGRVETGVDSLVGRRVVGEINASCGKCSICSMARPGHCPHRTVLGIVNRNGAFAEYLTLPAKNLHVVPDVVSTDAATFTEPLAAALQIQEQVKVGSATRALVVGDGKLGILVAQTLHLSGCHVVAIGRHAGKLDILSHRGIEISMANDFSGTDFDVAVECTGNPEGFALARQSLRPQGTLVMKSTYAGKLTFDASSFVVDEISLVGSRCGPFASALELLHRHEVNVESLIHERYSLVDGIHAFERARASGVLKVLIEMD
jgi:threonine dehydrogenase-like Zn-dependent dehydrogenase